MAGLVPQEVPSTLELVGAADANHGVRSSPCLAQVGGDLSTLRGTHREADSLDPILEILAFGDEMEDKE
jgi:hypothetical protein